MTQTAKVVLGLVVAASALLLLWFTYWGPTVTQPELPPLRELTEPNHKGPPETTKEYAPPNPTHHGGESIEDVRDS